jgi:hypothetical protein
MSRTTIRRGTAAALVLAAAALGPADASAQTLAGGGSDDATITTTRQIELYDDAGTLVGERTCSTYVSADPDEGCLPFLAERKASALAAAGATRMVTRTKRFYDVPAGIPVAVRATFEKVPGAELHTFEFKDGSDVTYRLDDAGGPAVQAGRASGTAARRYAKQRAGRTGRKDDARRR